MAYLHVKDLSLSYQQQVIFENLSFELKAMDRICLVGRNGAGKSSLLKIIAQLQQQDFGEIHIGSEVTIAYLSQDTNYKNDQTVEQILSQSSAELRKLIHEYNQKPTQDLFDLIERKSGWTIEERQKELMELFEINYSDMQIEKLSGGQARRLALVCMLLEKPDILILDEPTNHLDIGTITKLENYLLKYSGCVVLVSHDRSFIDVVATQIWELWDKRIFVHYGNYTKYLESKASRLENEETVDWKRKQFLKRELQWVNSGVKARGTKDKGRLNRYYDLESVQKSKQDTQIELIIPTPAPLGARILEVENLNLTIDGQKLIDKFSFDFQAWHKIGLVGDNGSGKTTFIKTITKQALKGNYLQTGTVKIGQNTVFLYLDQHKQQLDPEISPFEFLGHGLEKMPFGDIEIGVRKYLKSWLFDQEKYNTPIQYLSGGEKSRLLLAKNLTRRTNFLILDEPTNDLDLDTLNILEEAIASYPGPVLLVSHDRYFINRTCNTIFGFDGSRNIKVVTGNYYDYLNSFLDPNEKLYFDSSLQMSSNASPKISQKEQRQKQARIRSLEKEIETIESKIKNMKIKFEDPAIYNNMPKVSQMHFENEAMEKQVNQLMKEWEELQG